MPYPYNLESANCIFKPLIMESSLLNYLKALNLVFSPGPDGLPGCVLRYCAEELLRPLYNLFQLYGESCSFNDIWKASYIIPLRKKGNKP